MRLHGPVLSLVGNEPAGPARKTWDEAAQDAVSAGLAVWVADLHSNGHQLVHCACVHFTNQRNQ